MSRDPSNPASLRVLQAVQSIAGAVESSLAGINTHPLQDGTLVYCVNVAELYRFDRNSLRVADANLVVAPIQGPGRWLKQPVPSLLKGQITVPIAQINGNAQETVTASLPTAQVGDALALSPTADLPANLAVAWARVSAAGIVSINMANVGTPSIAPATFTFDVGALQSLPA